MIHFFPIPFTSDQTKILEIAKEKGYVSVEDVCVKLDLSQDRTLQALKTLEMSSVAKFTESMLKGKQWYFPSI